MAHAGAFLNAGENLAPRDTANGTTRMSTTAAYTHGIEFGVKVNVLATQSRNKVLLSEANTDARRKNKPLDLPRASASHPSTAISRSSSPHIVPRLDRRTASYLCL